MQLKDVLSDQAFIKSLLEKETVGEAQKAFRTKGLNFSELDIMNIWYHIKAHIENRAMSHELSLEQLDHVAGGEAIAMIGFYLSTQSFSNGARW